MELSAVGESVFAAESIIKRRIRRVLAPFFYPQASPSRLITQPFVLCDGGGQSCDNLNVLRICFFVVFFLQGRWEYLVKWKGWSQK